MNLYDTITQKALNSVIYKMLNYITITTPLNILSDLTNNYCTLEVDLKGNAVSGEEVIVTEDFTVTCTDRELIHLGYFLKLNYYYLPPDLDDSHDGEVLKTVTVPLSEVDNLISFEEYPVYLQGDCELILKNDGTVNLPTPTARVRLTADNHSIIFGNDVTLTATVSLDGEPVSGGTVSFYDDTDVLVGTGVTDSNGECTCTVEDLALGDYWYHAVYDEFSSNIVEVVSRKKNCNLTILTSSNTAYIMQYFRIEGVLTDEFGDIIKSVQVKLFRNGTQIATQQLTTSGTYSFREFRNQTSTNNYYVTYEGDATHNPVISNSKTINVTKAPTSITIQNNGSYTRGDNILISVSSNYTGFNPNSISVKFNGVTSTVSTKDSQGNFVYTVPSDVDNGDFVLTASYLGDAVYMGSSANSTISIIVVDQIEVEVWDRKDLNITFFRKGAFVANTQLNNIRIFKDNVLFTEFSATTEEYGQIYISNILQTGHSYDVRYNNISNTGITP